MEKENIYIENIPSSDPRLSRGIYHDERSKAYAFNTLEIIIKNIEHQRWIELLNQGMIGSCTGNAGIGGISTEPFENKDNLVYSRNEDGAIKLYQEAQKIDGVEPYPKNDLGSYGISIAKALKRDGIISEYQHTFTLNDALKALTVYPIIVGINWYEGMYNPDPDGRIHLTGKIIGGHEIQGFKIDVDNGRVWFYNSWGKAWGKNGTFYLTWADFAILLAQRGDVIVLMPVDNTPEPVTFLSAKITRNMGDKQTTGTLSTNGFSCDTLELPYKENQENISCIPNGKYLAKFKDKNDLGFCYELQDVPGRSGILIHKGNYVTDIEGCILLGNGYSDLNHDGLKDVLNSSETINKFNSLMGGKDFYLTIESAPTMPTLKKGSKGDAVKTLQKLLGNGLKIDGDFGAKTETAVKQYQQIKLLKVDGIVGKNTWSLLLTN